MLTFDMKKTKALSMPVLVEGIDQGHLRFKMVIEVNGVDYGFKATNEGDAVKFVIPPLEGVIKDLKDGVYNAKLEVSAITEGDRGFFMQPWSEQVRVKKSVSIEVAPIKEETKVETIEEARDKVKLAITSIFSDEDIEPAPAPVSAPAHVQECEEDKPEKKKKNSKLSKVLE